MASGSELSVFAYLDYRAFLRAYYEAKKGEARGFSYRAFARRVGFRSPNYLKLVIDGARSLSPSMATRFARGCGLAGDGARYFEDLVAFNQATTTPERNERYARLARFRAYRAAQRLELAHAEYHSTWYFPAIRELATRGDFRDDPTWISTVLVPSVTVSEARRALEVLLDIGLLRRDEQGRVRPTDASVTTGPETRGLHVANYHRTMLRMAADSIDTVPPAQRDISSLTLCLGPDGLSSLKQRVQAFRRELLDLSAHEADPEQVVQVNFQVFPLSRTRAEEQAAQ